MIIYTEYNMNNRFILYNESRVEICKKITFITIVNYMIFLLISIIVYLYTYQDYPIELTCNITNCSYNSDLYSFTIEYNNITNDFSIKYDKNICDYKYIQCFYLSYDIKTLSIYRNSIYLHSYDPLIVFFIILLFNGTLMYLTLIELYLCYLLYYDIIYF